MAAVEFILLLPLLLLIVVGIVEFGHLWYVRQAITNATREGARAGVVYYGSNRAARAQSQATAAVNNYLGLLPGQTPKLPGVTVTVPTPVVTANPQTGELTGGTLKVSATATNVALVLGELVSAFHNITVSAETTMRLE